MSRVLWTTFGPVTIDLDQTSPFAFLNPISTLEGDGLLPTFRPFLFSLSTRDHFGHRDPGLVSSVAPSPPLESNWSLKLRRRIPRSGPQRSTTSHLR
jgi:hypothetical protein